MQRKFKNPTDAKFHDWKQIPGLSASKLAGLKGNLLYYIKKPSKSLVKGLLPGVQLYRDGFLLQPFGSPISDRLKLIEKRVKRAGQAPLVPNRLFGFVDISRLLHPALKDTTSRQAMIETQELHELVAVLKSQTDFLEENILEQVSKPSWRKSARDQAIVVEQARLNSLGNLSVGIGHEIQVLFIDSFTGRCNRGTTRRAERQRSANRWRAAKDQRCSRSYRCHNHFHQTIS